MDNVMITGATKGMGRAIAMAFAKQGLNLAICSRNGQELMNFKNDLQMLNPQIKIVTLVADCSVKQEVIQFASYAEARLGKIDVIVNNLGMYRPTSILNDEENTFGQLIGTNLMPAYELYRYFGKKMMAARKGHVFNICSIAAIEPVTDAGTYTVTKFAQMGLSKVMKLEMQPYGVKVTTVYPGSTLTDSWKGTTIAAERFVLPEDIASAVLGAYHMSAGASVEEIIIKPVFGQV